MRDCFEEPAFAGVKWNSGCSHNQESKAKSRGGKQLPTTSAVPAEGKPSSALSAPIPASCSQGQDSLSACHTAGLLGFTDSSVLPQAKPQAHKAAFSVKPSAVCLKPTHHSFKKEIKRALSPLGSIPSPALSPGPGLVALQGSVALHSLHMAKPTGPRGTCLSKDCRNDHLASIRALKPCRMARAHS